jgi:DNA-binding SARP family transcriptional activator
VGVEAGVVTGVEIQVERSTQMQTDRMPVLTLQLLGPLAVHRAGAPLALPASRKVRALLAYLALARRDTSRSHLCELLWDLPDDPRGELRWCLSKLRGVLDEPGRPRVVAEAATAWRSTWQIASVDALRGARACSRCRGAAADRLEALVGAVRHAATSWRAWTCRAVPRFHGWLVAAAPALRAAHAARAGALGPGAAARQRHGAAALERWLAIAPFDRQRTCSLLQALASRGRLREGEEHLAATARQYEAEGQDWAPIGHAWRAAKSGHAGGVPVVASVVAETASPVTLPPTPRRPARLAGRHAVHRPHTRRGAARRPGRRHGARRHHPALQAAQHVRDRRRHDVRAGRTAGRLGRCRPPPGRGLRRQRVPAARAGRAAARGGAAGGDAQRAGRLGRGVFRAARRHLPVLDEIGNRIVTTIASQIEMAERNRAILKNPNSLDAWEAHHRGLWHMVRFNREDNEQARHFFQAAVRLDPTFARPHAGLSFTHFQDAFLDWRERGPAIEQAYRAAAEGVMADELDPASHWALGRAMWLKDRQGEALGELQTAIELSPNFALGHYTLAFVHAQSGDPHAAIGEADHARALSPLDPLLFGMLASRALALIRLGRYEEAADWGVRSAARPNAHVHIQAIAMVCLALAGERRKPGSSPPRSSGRRRATASTSCCGPSSSVPKRKRWSARPRG